MSLREGEGKSNYLMVFFAKRLMKIHKSYIRGVEIFH